MGGGSAGSMPALEPGQQQTVSIPVITLQPYASLAGGHQIQVILNPNLEAGQPAFVHPTSPYVMTATFPPNHCRPVTRQPTAPAGAAAPAPAGIPPPPPTRLPRR